MRCERDFADSGDPWAGLAAAQAREELGHAAAALDWVGPLVGTPAEADAWRLAGRVHWQRGDGESASDARRRELALRRQAGDWAAAAESAYALFYYAWASADYRTALDSARQSFEHAVEAADRRLQADALQALHIVLYEVGDLERAQAVLRSATGMLGSGYPADRARLLVYEGLIRLHRGRPALAHNAFEEALELAAGNGDDSFLRRTHLNEVKALLALGEVDRAALHLREAQRHSEPGGRRSPALLYYRARVLHARGRDAEAAEVLRGALGQGPDPAWARDLHYQLGVIEEGRGDLRSAEAAYRRSSEVVESMRAALGRDELKAWLLERKRRPFEALFRLQARSGRPREALATMERAKARTFLDAFVHATAEGTPETGSRELESDGGEIARAASERLEALEALLPSLNESPVFALSPLDDALTAIGDRQVLLYFAAGDELWLIVVRGGGVESRRLAAGMAEVEDRVHRFLARPDDVATATELGDLLLPSGCLGDPGGTLHVVTDGVLGRLPFAALRHAGRYLVEDHAVVYAPSVQALAAIANRPRESVGPAVVLADPRGDLSGAAREAREVADRLRATADLGAVATAERLRRASGAGVFHLATHTGLGPGGPWMELAGGRVTADRIVGWQVAPRLAVLAGCASAARRGGEMWGSLGAAFLAAGSQAVFASLWSVEDRATREVVLRFYDEGGADDPAGALARAQRALIAAGRPARIWAPFVLLGSDAGGAISHQQPSQQKGDAPCRLDPSSPSPRWPPSSSASRPPT